jgi:anti-sigma factor RsiW
MSEIPKDHRMEDLVLYQENLLEPDERRELEEHLRTCAECQATLAKVRRTLPLLHEALQAKELPAEELWRRAQAEVAAKRTRPLAKVLPFRRAKLAVAGFVAAAAVAAAIAVQSLLPSLESGAVAHSGVDAGNTPGTVAAPRRPGARADDAGLDAGDDESGGVGTRGGGER